MNIVLHSKFYSKLTEATSAIPPIAFYVLAVAILIVVVIRAKLSFDLIETFLFMPLVFILLVAGGIHSDYHKDFNVAEENGILTVNLISDYKAEINLAEAKDISILKEGKKYLLKYTEDGHDNQIEVTKQMASSIEDLLRDNYKKEAK